MPQVKQLRSTQVIANLGAKTFDFKTRRASGWAGAALEAGSLID
jgi:hypothetical protein